jgi:branched-chain amino acid transport system substrate-binding protein
MNVVRKKNGLGLKRTILAIATGSMLASAAAVSAGTIKVGVSLRMKTETGEKYGQMVVDEFNAINKAGGVNGHMIDVKLLNDECKSDIGVANATKFAYQDKVHLFVGSTCSSVSLPIVDVNHKAKVPMLIPHSTNYKITLKGSPWVYRLPISSRFSAAAAAKYTAENIGTKIAYIWASDAASQADAQKFFEYIEKFHGEPPVYAEQFQEGEIDLRPHLLKIKALKPQALMISAQSQDFARGLVQSYEVGIRKSVKRIGGSAASNRPAPILAKDAIEGVFFHAAFTYSDPNPAVAKFVEMTKERYGVTNPDHDFSQAWDLVQVAKIALERTKLTLTDSTLAADRAAIRDALGTVRGYKTLGGGVIDFCIEPTPECRDGNKTPVLIEYIKGGEDYEIRMIGRTTFAADFGLADMKEEAAKLRASLNN